MDTTVSSLHIDEQLTALRRHTDTAIASVERSLREDRPSSVLWQLTRPQPQHRSPPPATVTGTIMHHQIHDRRRHHRLNKLFRATILSCSTRY